MPFQAITMPPTVAFSKDAFPTADGFVGEVSFSLPIQALLSCVDIQAQYQAFVRFAALGSGAAYCHRAQPDLRFGTHHPARLSV
jgi:hypothetical protein